MPGDFVRRACRRRDALSGSEITPRDRDQPTPHRPARVLERMGARMTSSTGADRRRAGGRFEIARAPLVGTPVEADEVPLSVDELPLIALAAGLRARRDRDPRRRRNCG